MNTIFLSLGSIFNVGSAYRLSDINMHNIVVGLGLRTPGGCRTNKNSKKVSRERGVEQKENDEVDSKIEYITLHPSCSNRCGSYLYIHVDFTWDRNALCTYCRFESYPR